MDKNKFSICKPGNRYKTILSSFLKVLLVSQLALDINASPINVNSMTKISSTAPSTNGDIPALVVDPQSSQPIATDSIRVAYQGEPGAYSECATRELLGNNVIAIGRQDFESCYKAVDAMEADYACLPIENSLGGSIHENYDLMLRYGLTIVAEHELRVAHCMLVRPGVKKEDIKYAISHPQALAQCDNYLRGLGITPVKAYDTSGSAKMLSKEDFEKQFASRKGEVGGDAEPMTAYNTCAIASELAGKTYGLDCLDKSIEDDDSNFTRFLLLARKGVGQYLTHDIPAKTSVVFTLPNEPGALYKALACFSLRDIDFSKIESRPTSATLLNFLKFRAAAMGGSWGVGKKSKGVPRFRFCFYLDILINELDEDAQNALHHLREQADFCRVLGSYPQRSRLVGPVKEAVDQLKFMTPLPLDQVSLTSLPSDTKNDKLNIGIIGFGSFGQLLAKKFKTSTHHKISCLDVLDKSKEAKDINIDYYPMFNMPAFLQDLDVIVLSVPLIKFADVVTHLPSDYLRKKLIVEVCPLNAHPKSVLLSNLPQDVDIICSHPMFSPNSCKVSGGFVDDGGSWDTLPFVYEKVRVLNNPTRAQEFLDIFSHARCKMVEMTAEQHDVYTANAEFVTHLTGRILNSKSLLPPTPIVSKEYELLKEVAEMTDTDSFDLFYGMFKFNEENAKNHMREMRERLSKIEMQLAAKEAYLAAKAEIQDDDRQRLIEECKTLFREVAKDAVQQQHPVTPTIEDVTEESTGDKKKK